VEDQLQLIFDAVVNGELEIVEDTVRKAIKLDIPANNILKDALIPSMAKVGNLFEEGDFYIPEMLVSARAMKAGLTILKPLLIEENVKSEGKVVIGSIRGDLHDIGKNLVAIMLEGAGFEVIDLGVDVAPEVFITAVKQGDISIIALSALLTTTMINMKSTIDALKEAGLREKVKVMVGGAPLSESYAYNIGADGYSADAGQAAELAKSWVRNHH
jgi:5-methyltetrahydrofolate--homocysteine methyltransferase